MILVLGQSNAGNHGADSDSGQQGPQATFVFEGNCYRTAGPAPGATGHDKSIWPLLAQRLESATGKPVVFSVLAVESTRVAQWIEPGSFQHLLIETLASNRKDAFVPDLVIWQQGEADAIAGTSATEYREQFAQLVTFLRRSGVSVPIFAALSTRCRNTGGLPIRQAIAESVRADRTLRLGPDTDALSGLYRHDDCHFSEAGLEAAADLWAQSIIANR